MNNIELLDRAQDLIYEEKYKKALKFLDKRFPVNDEGASWLRIEALLALEESVKATAIFEEQILAGGSTPDRWCSYIQHLMGADMQTEAEKAIDVALQHHIGDSSLLLEKAEVLFQADRKEEAEQAALAIKIPKIGASELLSDRAGLFSGWAMVPDTVDETVVGKGGIKYSRRLLEMALSDYSRAVQESSDKQLRFRRADVLANLNRYDEAAADIDVLLKDLPEGDGTYRYFIKLKEEYLAGPDGDRQSLANMLRESVAQDFGVNRSAAEGVVHDVIESAAQKVLSGEDLESALSDMATEDDDTWLAVSIARQIFNVGNLPASDWQEVSANEFSRAAVRWAEKAQSRLEGLGFRLLGDYEDVALTPVIGQRVFMRLMLSEDGTSWAAIFKFSMPWPGLLGWLKLLVTGKWAIPGVFELESATESGQFVSTGNMGTLDPFGYGPKIDKCALSPTTSFQSALDMHLSRRSAQAREADPFVSVNSIRGVLEQQERQRKIKNSYRQSIGYAREEELRLLLADRYEDLSGLVKAKIADIVDADG